MPSPTTTAVIQELAPTGKLRVAINLGNIVLAQKDAATGTPRGVTADLAHELGRRLGVPVELFPFDGAYLDWRPDAQQRTLPPAALQTG